MGIGHAAVALGASRAAPRINVGLLIFSALLADFLLGVFAAFGLESAHISPDFAARHYLTFTFSYSHGFVSLLLWGMLLGGIVCWTSPQERRRAFYVVAGLVISHYFLDALVHVPELPLLGEASPKLGLGLWNHMVLELSLETLMAFVGLALYWKLARTAAVGRLGVTAMILLLTALTWTQLWMVSPPTHSQLVTSWILVPLVFSAILFGFDRRRLEKQPASG